MMKKIYAYSGKVSEHSIISRNSLYLLLRTLSVAAISAAIVMLVNLFVTIPSMTHLVFFVLVCGWLTLGYGFFGGIIALMRK